MGRLLLFLAGIAIGAAGMYLLMQDGRVLAPAPVQVAPAPPGDAIPIASEPATSPPLSAPVAAPAELPPPVPAAAPASIALAPPSSSANASEQAVPSTPEAAASITAATTAASTPGGQLLVPVQGVLSSQLVDTFTQARGEGRLHDAIDIMATRGTPVLAVADGRVAKLFDSKPGGLTVYQFDSEEKLAYYYAHLDHYAAGLAEGQQLKRGEVLGYVGSTGNASESAPHLHFAVFVLGPDKKWWQGTAVNPYPLLGGK